jgi:hypothetical protein
MECGQLTANVVIKIVEIAEKSEKIANKDRIVN